MVILDNPKHVENLAGVIRASACFDGGPVIWTGDRLTRQEHKMRKLSAGHAIDERKRMMREFKHADYQHVLWEHSDNPFDLLRRFFPQGMAWSQTPELICVEVDGAETLNEFRHPLAGVYMFGPEDGNVSEEFRRHARHTIRIPSKFCLNLAATVNVVLADRYMKGLR